MPELKEIFIGAVIAFVFIIFILGIVLDFIRDPKTGDLKTWIKERNNHV